ncbi:MAG: DMT family transporter [Desulfobacteraceae bacterium]|nr:DMT family transporter [Desulfobacteraceae bacterium]
MICIAVLGEAVFLLLKKELSTEVSNLTITCILTTLGLIFFLPFAAYQSLYFNFRSVGWLGWSAIVYFGAVFTVAAYIFWFRGISNVSGGTASAFTAVMPVSAVFLSWIFLEEPLTVPKLFGITCVLLAIFLIAKEPKEKPAKTKEYKSRKLKPFCPGGPFRKSTKSN